jgi:hypothetical protein
MKKQASSELCKILVILVYPKYDKKMCYYQEFWKIYLMNEIMISKIKDYSVSNKEISGKIEELEVYNLFNLGSRKVMVSYLGPKV